MSKKYLLCVLFVFFMALSVSFANQADQTHPKNPKAKPNLLIAQAPSIATTSETSLPVKAKRVITFKNSCSFPVHFAFVGGAVKQTNGELLACSDDSQCPIQTRCNKDVGNCFWTMPKPHDGKYDLAPGRETSITYNAYDYGTKLPSHILWSGLFTARAECDGKNCKIADCLPFGGKEDCNPGTGVQQPATQAEFTLQTVEDYYDVEVINGVSLPVEMAPSSEQERHPITAPADKDAAYWCGNPGGVKTMTPHVGACAWNRFMPPSNDYIWVTAGGTACHTGSECNGDEICGLSFSREGNQIKKTCGKYLGFWTANEVCGVSRGTHGAPFYCENNANLQKCQSGELSESCYSKGAANTCCGCINWHTLGLTIPPTTHQCEAINPKWVDAVLPTIKWLKEKCPTIYTYPFDDPSSTFQCSNAKQGQINTTNYTITFCPGGEMTSLPKCASDADCKGYPGTMCKASMCVPGIGVGCNAPGGNKCPADHLCNADGTCQHFTQGPPTPPKKCESDEQCTNKDPNKPICNRTTGQCEAHQPPPSGGCKSGSDCPSNTPLCIFAPGHETGNCQAGVACSTDANCGHNKCKNGICVKEQGCAFPAGRCPWIGSALVSCHSSGYCPVETTFVPPKKCESDQQCKDEDPTKPYCNKETGQCEKQATPPTPPPSKGCKSKGTCTPGVDCCAEGKECLETPNGNACITPGSFCMPGQMCPGEIHCPAFGDPIFGDPVHNRVHCPAQ